MAKKTAGSIVYIQSGALGAAKVITGITQANPAVVSCPSHGFSNGDVVVISGVGGMQQVNNRAFVVAGATDSPATPNSFELKGVDSTNYTAFEASSPNTGTASKATLIAIGEVRDIPELGGTEPNEFDVSHLQSVSEQKLAGLPRQSNVSFNIWFDPSTAGHSTLLLANEDLEDRTFMVTQPTSWKLTFVAQVGGVKVSGGDVNSAYSASVTLLPRAAGAWSTI